VINCGSSSLKYQLIHLSTKAMFPQVLSKGLVERIGIDGSQLNFFQNEMTRVVKQDIVNHQDAIELVFDNLVNREFGVIKDLSKIYSIGHRVVHGGEYFQDSVVINDDVKGRIRQCFDLAPLHNPPNLIGIEACEKVIKKIPQVAVFDTAFHQTISPELFMYPLPYEYYDKYKIRKYGFHGTSHKYVANRAAEFLGKSIEKLKIITCHLGNGSSITAINGGKSVDTSMGFTPLAGLPMGTRCGDIDPAIVTFLIEKEKLNVDEINSIMNKKSGVLGISGVSSDFRDINNAINSGNNQAKLAIDIFVKSIKKYIGSYIAILGGLDILVFTGGIGENDSYVRMECVNGLKLFGISIDEQINKTKSKEERNISTENAQISTLVIPTNEELMIAQEAFRICNCEDDKKSLKI